MISGGFLVSSLDIDILGFLFSGLPSWAEAALCEASFVLHRERLCACIGLGLAHFFFAHTRRPGMLEVLPPLAFLAVEYVT